MEPDPSQLSPRFTQPGRRWIPLSGPYKDRLGAEVCANSDFSFVGLKFPGETQYRVFSFDDLKPAD